MFTALTAATEQLGLPLAADRGFGTIIYMPFDLTRLWNRAAGRAVPEWAHAFGAHTWAQFFLKFLAADPQVTLITPATCHAVNMAANQAAAVACRTRRCGSG